MLPGLPIELTTPTASDESDEAFLERIADAIVRRRMSAPAILLLESVKPLNFVGNQLMVFMDPIIKLFADIPDYARLTRMLENRDTIERLLQAIERRDDNA
ncbi:MAG: hypothetical protein FJX76_28575 [Armatimonadetes bacterium]|nr:hypothetical protein [Armatimonadota bacterium]